MGAKSEHQPHIQRDRGKVMGGISFLDRVRDFIGAVAFRILLWSVRMSREKYWSSIYHQERQLRKDYE